MGLIDKLDVRIPAGAPYTRRFRKLVADIGQARAFQPDPHYEFRADLRPFGFQSVLHGSMRYGERCDCGPSANGGCRCGKPGGSNKLEIIDSGKMPYSAMVHEIEQVYEIDGRTPGVLRLDLCADVAGVPVPWFAQHARILCKRTGRAVGLLEMERIGTTGGGIETLYYGVRPNQIRIYNKVAEYKHEFDVRRRGATAAEKAAWPEFEDVYRISPDAVLTRVERQIGGGARELQRDGGELSTVWRLKANLEIFDPFDKLELVSAGKREPTIATEGRSRIVHYAAGMYFRHLLEDEGWTMHELRGWINKHSRRNVTRILRDYAEFLPSEWRISVGRITEIYRRSIYKQLAA